MQPPVKDISTARYYRCAASTERGIRTVALRRATAGGGRFQAFDDVAVIRSDSPTKAQ